MEDKYANLNVIENSGNNNNIAVQQHIHSNSPTEIQYGPCKNKQRITVKSSLIAGWVLNFASRIIAATFFASGGILSLAFSLSDFGWEFADRILALFMGAIPQACILTGLPAPIYALSPLVMATIIAALFLFSTQSQKDNGRILASKLSVGDKERIGRKYVERISQNEYLVAKGVAPCPYPNCSGSIQIRQAPPRAKSNNEYIGSCSKDKKGHTFTAETNLYGSAKEFDWRPPEKASSQKASC